MGNAYYKQSNCCHVCRGIEVIHPNYCRNQSGDIRQHDYYNYWGGGECGLFYTGVVYCWASPPRSIAGEAVPALYLGNSCTHSSESFSDFDRLLCVELSLLAGYIIGGDMLYLHFEAWD